VKLDCAFYASAFSLADCPRWPRREIALVGRSNVGKSSLLNALAASKGLARTSRTPGRTRSLNFFALGDDLAIVDLPGYGYALMSHAQALTIARMMHAFLEQRANLRAILLLIDVRRAPRDEELALIEIARGRSLKLIIALTKCDKANQRERAAAVRRMASLGERLRFCSAVTGEGIEELRRELFTLSSRSAPPVRAHPA